MTHEDISLNTKHILVNSFKKFMKKNPNMTSPDFYMVMYNETAGLVN